jgi:radical SAM protein with 4Fe4S-binding SPASM domain
MVHHKNLKYLGVSLYTTNPLKYAELLGLPPGTINKAAHLVERMANERPDVIINIGTTKDSRYVSTEELKQLDRVGGFRVSPHEITENRAVNGFCQSPPYKTQCVGMFSRVFVLKDGEVSICCFDPNCELNIGNATENTILEIWNGERMRKYRDLHNTGRRSEIDLCASCNHAL